jgi:ABC-type molybdenum transport system ATPase subunit/photorepair protein PhrA
MLLVGKPGSGKTTLLKQLLTNPQMYYRKFDDVFIVSPSHAKMGLKVRKENSTAQFSLDWIFGKFAEINEKQLDRVFGSKLKRSSKDKKSANETRTLASGVLMNDGRSRFLLSDAFNSTPAGATR